MAYDSVRVVRDATTDHPAANDMSFRTVLVFSVGVMSP